MSRKLRLTTVFTGLAITLLAAATVAWWLATNRMKAEFDAWQQARIADGVTITTGPASRGGWPLEAELLLPNVTIATDTPGQADAIAWSASQLRLTYAPWHPLTVHVLVDGDQTLRFGAAPPVGTTVDRLDVVIPLGAAGQAEGVTAELRGASIPLPGGPARIGSASIQVRDADAFLSASALTISGRSLPFGGTIQSLDLHARSTGPIPPLRDPAAALAAWRDRSQRVLIDGLALQWGPLDVRGHASLGLDAALQPEGTADVQLTGFAEVADALARSGAISRNDARVATTLLGLMARPGAGNVSEADLPLILKDRTLSVGAIPVLKLPPMVIP